MADKPVAASVDVLSKAERELVVSALEMKVASLNRSIRSEANPQIRSIRSDECDVVLALVAKFR